MKLAPQPHSCSGLRSLVRSAPSKSLFASPLFSWSCELLLPQLLSFDNHLRCPRGVGTALLSETLPLRCTVANPLFSRVCRLLDSLASLFRAPVLCFQQLADSFCKTPGGGVLSWASQRSAVQTLPIARYSDRLCRPDLPDVPTLRHSAKIHPTPL